MIEVGDFLKMTTELKVSSFPTFLVWVCYRCPPTGLKPSLRIVSVSSLDIFATSMFVVYASKSHPTVQPVATSIPMFWCPRSESRQVAHNSNNSNGFMVDVSNQLLSVYKHTRHYSSRPHISFKMSYPLLYVYSYVTICSPFRFPNRMPLIAIFPYGGFLSHDHITNHIPYRCTQYIYIYNINDHNHQYGRMAILPG